MEPNEIAAQDATEPLTPEEIAAADANTARREHSIHIYGHPFDPAPGQPLCDNPRNLNPLIQRFEPNRTLPDELFHIQPWGHYCVVVREPTVGQIGAIIVPEGAKEPQNRGYVVSVGPLVGVPSNQPNALGYCPFPRADLLCARVLWGVYSGTALAIAKDPTFDKDSYRVRLDDGGFDPSGRPSERARTDYLSPYMMIADTMFLGEWPPSQQDDDKEVPSE